MRTAKIILHTFVGIGLVFYTLATALLAVPLTANAQTVGVPATIGYNGRLFNASGTALSGTYYFWVDLEPALTGGTNLGSNIQGFADADGDGAVDAGETAITVTNGFFTMEVPIGSDVSDFANNVWLELKVHTADVVGSAETLSPRVKVTKNPYSIFTQAIENSSADPSVAFAGRSYYDTDEGKLKVYDGVAAAWVTMEGYTNGATMTVDNSNATAINIGAGAVAKTITLGNSTGATSLVLNAGTGALNIGTNAIAHTVTLGNTTGATAVQVNTGTGGFGVDGPEFDIAAGTGAIAINDSADAGSLTVEGSVLDINSLDFVGAGGITSAAGTALNVTSGTTGALTLDSGSTGAVNVGTGASAKTITIGNAASTESEVNGLLVDINGGTGGVTIDGGAASNFSTSVGALTLSTSAGGTSSSVILRSVDTSSDAILLDADGGSGSGIYLDAYDATTNTSGAITMDAGSYMQINTYGATGPGSAGFDLNVGSTGTIALSTDNGSVSINAGGSGTATMSSSSGDVSIDTTTASRSITIGDSDFARTINIGEGTGADTLNLGSGADTFNFVSSENTNDPIDVTFASLTTADAFDIDTAALTTGDVFDITYTGTTGAAIRVTDSTGDDINDMVFLNNTDATLTAQTYLIRGQYADTGDANGDFLLFEDAGGTDQFVVGQDGDLIITGVAEGTASLTQTAGDHNITDGDLNVTAGDFVGLLGDFNWGLEDADTANIDGDGSPTADILSLGVGDTSATDNVDALLITSNVSGASGTALHIDPDYTTGVADDYSAISVDAFAATTTANVASNVKGFNVGNLTETENTLGNITSVGIDVGTGWDVGLSLGSALRMDDDVALEFGTSGDAAFRWETADVNANALHLVLPDGDATNVPVFAIGDASMTGDLTFFNGITDNTFAVVSDDAGDYISIATLNSGDAEIKTNVGDIRLNIAGANLAPSSNDGAALGISGAAFSDLFLASGAVVNFDAGDVTLTHSANLLSLNDDLAVLGGDVTGANGDSIDIAEIVDSQFTLQLNSDSAAVLTVSDTTDGNTPLTISSAGTGLLTLDPAGAGAMNIGSADVTGVSFFTNDDAANDFAFNGGATFNDDVTLTLGASEDLAITDSAPADGTNIITVSNTGTSNSYDMLDLALSVGAGDAGADAARALAITTPASAEAGDSVIGIDFDGTAGGGSDIAIRVDAGYDTDIDATTSLELGVGGTNEITLSSSAFSPATTDSNALGTTTLMWSDLFLASGAVVNFNNGDVTITHAADVITIAGGTLDVDSAIDFDGTTFDVDGSGLVSLTSTAASLTLSATDTGNAGDDNIVLTVGNAAPDAGEDGNDIALEAEDSIILSSASNSVDINAGGDSANNVSIVGGLQATRISSTGNSAVMALTVGHRDSDSFGSNGIGVGLEFQVEDADNTESHGDIVVTATDVTATTEESKMEFKVMSNGTLYEALDIQGLAAGTQALATLTGTADGTTALSVTAGDVVLNDGNLTLQGGAGESRFNFDGSGFFHVRHVGGQDADVFQLTATGNDADGVDGQYINWSGTDVNGSAALNVNLQNNVTAAAIDTVYGMYMSLDNNEDQDNVYGAYLTNVDDAGNIAPDAFVYLNQAEADVGMADGIFFNVAAGGLTDAIDAQDDQIDNALNIGANDIEGTTGTITFTDFTVGSDGQISSLPDGDVVGLSINSEATSANLIDLTYENTSGTLIDVTSDTVTAAGALVGMKLDLDTGVSDATTAQSHRGMSIDMPDSNWTGDTGAGPTSSIGILVDGDSVILNDSAGADANVSWTANGVTMPDLTLTAGASLVGTGYNFTNGTITTAGSYRGFNVSGTGIAVGVLDGFRAGNITGGGGTETVLNIGSGWDTDINATTSLEIGIGGTNELYLDGDDFSPITDAGNALGTAALGWNDLFLDTGAVINFEGGDVTLTHAANSLSMAGGDLNVEIIDGQTINFDGDATPSADILTIGVGDTFTTDGVDALQITFTENSGSGNAIDITPSMTNSGPGVAKTMNIIDVDAFTALSDTNGGNTTAINALNLGNLTQTETLGTVSSVALNVGSGWDQTINAAGVLTLAVANFNEVLLSGTTMTPAANDGNALGSGTNSWSDLFLADGGVVNLNNGDVTLTHSSNALTINGGSFNNTFDPGADTAGTSASIQIDGEDTTGGGDEVQRGLRIFNSANGTNVDEAADALLVLDNVDGDDAVNIGIDFDITGAGAFTTDISLQNAENIVNSTDDMLDFIGTGGADNTDLRIDLDGTRPVLISPTDAVIEVAEDFEITGGNLFVTLDNEAARDFALCVAVDDGGAAPGTTLQEVDDCDTAAGADYAERYPVAEGATYGQIVVPGTTMITTNDANHGTQQIAQAVLSSVPYQGPVYGILSNNYGDFTSAGANIEDADNPMPVALVGRVPVKVVAEGGSIQIGDYLTTSSTPGAAMKATQSGRVIGMALENWNGEKDTVMVQVNNSWYQAPTSESSDIQGGSSGAVVVADSVTASDASFEGSVTVAEHLYGSHDMAGRIRMASEETSVRVTFETPYEFLPIVTFSSRSNSLDAREAWISNEDETGFTLNRPDSTSGSQVEFNWIAVGIEDAQVTVSDLQGGFVQISVTDQNGPSAPAPVVEEEEAAVVEETPVVEEAPAEEPVVEETPVVEEAPAEVPAEEPVL